MRTVTGIDQYTTSGAVSYITPSDCDDSGVVFHLLVRNEHGLVFTEEVTLLKESVTIDFNRWEDSLQSSVTNSTRDFVIIGEQIRYYVNVSANSAPTSVRINGTQATKSGEFVGSSVSNTTWYITWSNNNKGIYDFDVTVEMNEHQTTASMPQVKVYGLILGDKTTSVDRTGNTIYVLQNSNYANTSMTAVNTNLSANNVVNYYNLFTFDNNRIKSVARGQYLNGTTGTINFGDSGTSYTTTTSSGNLQFYYRSGYRSYYIRQSNTTTVSMSTNNSYRTWALRPVTYDMP